MASTGMGIGRKMNVFGSSSSSGSRSGRDGIPMTSRYDSAVVMPSPTVYEHPFIYSVSGQQLVSPSYSALVQAVGGVQAIQIDKVASREVVFPPWLQKSVVHDTEFKYPIDSATRNISSINDVIIEIMVASTGYINMMVKPSQSYVPNVEAKAIFQVRLRHGYLALRDFEFIYNMSFNETDQIVSQILDIAHRTPLAVRSFNFIDSTRNHVKVLTHKKMKMDQGLKAQLKSAADNMMLKVTNREINQEKQRAMHKFQRIVQQPNRVTIGSFHDQSIAHTTGRSRVLTPEETHVKWQQTQTLPLFMRVNDPSHVKNVLQVTRSQVNNTYLKNTTHFQQLMDQTELMCDLQEKSKTDLKMIAENLGIKLLAKDLKYGMCEKIVRYIQVIDPRVQLKPVQGFVQGFDQ